MDKGKIFTIGLWALLGFNYLLDFSSWVNYFAILLLSIHLVEYIVFYKRIKNAGENFLYGFFMTLIFGILYIDPLKDS